MQCDFHAAQRCPAQLRPDCNGPSGSGPKVDSRRMAQGHPDTFGSQQSDHDGKNSCQYVAGEGSINDAGTIHSQF